MIFRWESEEERLSRSIKIPPKKKMEWLRKMHELISKYASKRERLLRQKLREMR